MELLAARYRREKRKKQKRNERKRKKTKQKNKWCMVALSTQGSHRRGPRLPVRPDPAGPGARGSAGPDPAPAAERAFTRARALRSGCGEQGHPQPGAAAGPALWGPAPAPPGAPLPPRRLPAGGGRRRPLLRRRGGRGRGEAVLPESHGSARQPGGRADLRRQLCARRATRLLRGPRPGRGAGTRGPRSKDLRPEEAAGCRGEGGGGGEAKAAKPEEAARSLLPGASLRAGAAVQAAALPVGARAGAPGQQPQAHVHAGEDLVPEPALQVQAAAAGQVAGAGWHRGPAAAAQGGRARAGPRRQAVPRRVAGLQLSIQRALLLQRFPRLRLR